MILVVVDYSLPMSVLIHPAVIYVDASVDASKSLRRIYFPTQRERERENCHSADQIRLRQVVRLRSFPDMMR